MVKVTTPQLKQLSDLILSLGDSCPPQYKLTLSKLQRDFEEALQTFAMAQKQSARKSKEELEGAKRAVQRGAAAAGGQSRSLLIDEEEQGRDGGAQEGDFDGQQQQQQQQQLATSQAGPSLAELEFQETLIAEREVEIREIESGIHELNEIFRDLGAIVQEQGGMIDNIEYNIGEIATNTEGADRELVTAQEYQRKAGKRAACLLLIVGFVISVVLLAVSTSIETSSGAAALSDLVPLFSARRFSVDTSGTCSGPPPVHDTSLDTLWASLLVTSASFYCINILNATTKLSAAKKPVTAMNRIE